MDIKQEFADSVEITYGFLDLIISRKDRPRWPQTVNRIIFATGGEVTTGDLRPDIVKAIVENKSLMCEIKKAYQ